MIDKAFEVIIVVGIAVYILKSLIELAMRDWKETLSIVVFIVGVACLVGFLMNLARS